ncbi:MULTISPECIES: response regulator transcription factor [Sphingobacterium]|uniref:DNA-binding response regulator n=1 Tax=Sphingobacterium athyrii TaxID=2152717 RepID=A0A363NU39_9SPHI|nr:MULTISPECIES: response regulator transcription factor [Sphingobacterium]PUV24289.1 DNA-binding response regulator [Sphingobacterium athyrii]QIH33974.1 response regulator transcription factor [Sphingobacterium sp. DR205]
MAQLLLVDDHALVRSGFRLILETQEDITVIAEAENGKNALEYLVDAPQPDLILTDLHMDKMDGIRFIKAIKARYPDIKIIILTMDNDFHLVANAFDLGVDGYLLKSSHLDEILFGIRQVQRGGRYISSALSFDLMDYSAQHIPKEVNKTDVMTRYDLSERELLVLERIAEGYTNAEIADQIFLSKRTVEGHRQQLLEKTNSRNTAGLIRFGFKTKLLS